MAGGKETPRQKMIGMMYLVLTALLALNVSKQIIAAFVTINDKLDRSSHIIDQKNHSTYSAFEKKKITVKAQGGDVSTVQVWQDRAHEVDLKTREVISFLLSECNEMIKTSEGVDWVEETDDNGNITKLKPLADIAGMDNYDIPTNMFIGGNPEKPVERGLEIRKRVIQYRNDVAVIMATYKDGKGDWSFTPPENLDGLSDAMSTCNPDDTAALGNFMRSLDIPEEITQKIHGEEITHPWPSAMFDHAPIVAAAAIFTALKLDVRNSESLATDFLLSKVDVQEFDFNKIEPLAFASTGYINQGDSLNLRVMIAAYDSTETPKVSWGLDADTANQENWKPASNPDGSISLKGDTPGTHKVKGVIMVKQRGLEVPKPWDFTYNVGKPMGVVALPEMRILYWGYNNVVEGTASGFDPKDVTLSGSGVSLSSKGNGQYIAKVNRGTRSAKISVSGKKADGSSVSLGSFDFECRPMPDAEVTFGGVKMGGSLPYANAKATNKVRVAYGPDVPLSNVSFTITGGQLYVEGLTGAGSIGSGGSLDGKSMSMIKQAKGKQVTIMVDYKGPDGVGKKSGVSFRIK